MADTDEQASKLEGYKQDFYQDFNATVEQRDKSNEEIRFAMVTGGQWEGFLEPTFENRARIELDQTAEYLYRTYAQWTENRIGVTYVPDDDDSTDDDAELLEGLFRRDLRRRNGQTSIDQAVFEAMACGVGAFHLATEYEDEEDPDNEDQCVCFSELANAYATVIWDSSARKRDKSDAQRCTILIPHSPEGFKTKYPDAKNDSSMRPTDRRIFNWTAPKLVYEAIRYEVRVEDDVLYTFGHPETEDIVKVSAKDLKNEEGELKAAGYVQLSKKKIRKRNVYRTIFCGGEVLEDERRIAGRYIPVIPVYGYVAHIDGVDHWHGVIRKKMDGQRLLNMAASLMAESAASATEDKPIFDPAQVEGVKQVWSQDRHQHPYLLARALRHPETGQLEQAGPLGFLPGASQAASAQQLLNTVRELIQQGTGGAPQDIADPQASGKAINAVLKRVDMNTQPIFDNVKTAMRHAGEVFRWIAAEVYAERTRSINVVTQAGDMQRRQLLQVGVKQGQITYSNDPSKGRFEVVPDTGPSYHTQREQSVEALKDIVRSMDPTDPLQRVVMMRIIELLPTQGMDDIKDYIRQQMLLQGVRKPETPEDMQVLQKAQAQQGQPNSQDQLMQSMAQNQRMQAAERVSTIHEKDSRTQANLATAALNMAKARETAMSTHQQLQPQIQQDKPEAPPRPRLRLVSAQ